MNENLINKTDNHFYHYSIVISIFSKCFFIFCGFYLSNHICQLESIQNNTDV